MTLPGFARVACLLAVFGIAVATQAQAQPTRSIEQITDNLYKAQNDNHFTVFLVTPEGIILSDTINRDFSEWLLGELNSRFGVPVRYVIYSHHHWDHASGGQVFANTANFVGHESIVEAMAMPPGDTALPGNVAGMDRNRNGSIEMSEAGGNIAAQFMNYDEDGDGSLTGAEVVRGPIADVHPADRFYSDRTTISLGGNSVELIHVDTPHAPDMTVLRFPNEDAVFFVDFLSLRRLPFTTIPGYDIASWLNAVRAVEAMDYSIAIGGHGATGNKQDVTEHREYFEELRDAVAEGIADGDSLAEIQASVSMDDYDDWASYPDWAPLNVEGMYRMLTGL